MNADHTVRGIFNSKATRFLGEANGLHFRSRKGAEFFRPVNEIDGKNVIELCYLPDGRRCIDIPRSLLNGRFRSLFRHPGSSFLILHEPSHGMVQIEQTTKQPSQEIAYCRVWPLRDTSRPVGSVDHWTVAKATRIIIDAARKLRTHELKGTKLGRPPKDIQDARMILASHEAIAAQVSQIAQGSRQA